MGVRYLLGQLVLRGSAAPVDVGGGVVRAHIGQHARQQLLAICAIHRRKHFPVILLLAPLELLRGTKT